jgi:Vacuolar protein 14 C-terminal Fig4p binding
MSNKLTLIDQDLEFASVIVQKLNIILITSPELVDFRKRLKSLETRVSLGIYKNETSKLTFF